MSMAPSPRVPALSVPCTYAPGWRVRLRLVGEWGGGTKRWMGVSWPISLCVEGLAGLLARAQVQLVWWVVHFVRYSPGKKPKRKKREEVMKYGKANSVSSKVWPRKVSRTNHTIIGGVGPSMRSPILMSEIGGQCLTCSRRWKIRGFQKDRSTHPRSRKVGSPSPIMRRTTDHDLLKGEVVVRIWWSQCISLRRSALSY